MSVAVQRLASGINVQFIAYRYRHHAGPSGYDRFADYLGERLSVTPRLAKQGETWLKAPAKLIEMASGVFEYRRPDVLQELAVISHMRQQRHVVYHFLYAEKSLYLVAGRNGWRGNRVVGSFHHCPDSYPRRYRSTKFLRNIEHAVVVSGSQIEYLESIVGQGNVSFVPYAVDANYFRASDSPTHDRPLRCACIGEHLRDFESLAGVIRGITSALPEAEFYVIGAPLRLEATFREIRGVIWKRGISDEEYLALLQNIDLLVLPLTNSTSVTSVNEALGCGVPVITNPGGVEDYLNKECSVIRPVGDIVGMVEAAVELLKDEDLRRRMGQAAREMGLELDWPNSAKKMQEVYDRLG